MAFDQKSGGVAFTKLSRYLARLEKKLAPESVHRFRTYSRRVEAVVSEFASEPSGNQKKVLRCLERLRKKAGKVRDLDVQIAALRSLKIPQDAKRKSRLMRTLIEERAQGERKLPKTFDEETVSELRKRLKRAAKKVHITAATDPVAKAVRLFADVGKDHVPVNEKKLHQYRIAGKRARYLAELALPSPEAKRVVDELKHMQDVIGDWHDWLKLTLRAQGLFGGLEDSSLVAALHNITRAKFRQSLHALGQAQAALLPKGASPELPSTRKQPPASAVQPAA